jgi:anti-anti-sigma regulatory factor
LIATTELRLGTLRLEVPGGSNMAKYRHRIFEMYEGRNEAVRALAPAFEDPETEAVAETWVQRLLAVSRSAGVTHVTFQKATTFGDETINDLRDDFAQIAEKLGKDSKVLMDFAGVASFSPASINVLAQFNEKLRTKGSRMVLCALDPTARECFFAVR